MLLQTNFFVSLNILGALLVFACLTYIHRRYLRNYRLKYPTKKYSVPLILGSLVVPIFGMLSLFISGIRITEHNNAASGLNLKFSETSLGIALVLLTPVVLVIYWILIRAKDIQLKKKYEQDNPIKLSVDSPKDMSIKEAVENTTNFELKVEENERLQNSSIPMSNSYQFRKSLFENERFYELVDDGMRISEGAQLIQFIPYKAIQKVRLYYKPGRINNFNFMCDISYKGELYQIKSSHYVDFGKFENRNSQYAAFIRSLVKTIDKENPSTQLLAGYTGLRYALYMIISLGGVFLIAFSLILFPIPMGGILLILRLLLILYLTYYSIIVMKNNQPRKIVNGLIPDDAIPRQ